MNSKVVAFFKTALNRIGVFYENSLFGKVFNKIWSSLGRAFAPSFISRFFNDAKKRESIWDESVFGKILNMPKTFILFLQKKIAPGLRNLIDNSVILTTLSSWDKLSVRVYGIALASFSVATCILRENSIKTYALLGGLLILSVLMILIDRSINQLLSGSKIVKLAGELFTECDFSDEIIKPNRGTLISAAVVGIIASCVLLYAGISAFVLIFGAIFGFLFMLKYLSISVFLTVALSPVLPTMALVGMSFLSAFVFIVHILTNPKTKFSKNAFNVVVIFFIIALLFGAFNVFSTIASVKQVLVHLAFIMFYFILTNVITTKKQWLALIKVFIFSAFVVSLYGLAQNFLGFSSTESWIDEEMFENIKTRVCSFFDNPNVLGEFLVLTIPIAIAILVNRVKGIYKCCFFVFLVSMAMCMVFTWSRGAWLGMLLAVALYLVITDRRWMFAGILLLLLVPIGLYASGNTAILERFISIGNTADTSTAYRVSIWKASIAMIRDFWVGGIGIGSDAYTTIYPSYALPGARFALHSHNLYLQYIVETGIFGIVSLLSVLFGFIKTVFSKSVVKNIKNSDVSKILVALGCSLLGFMLQGLTDYVFYNYKILMIFWIVIALGISGAKILKENKGGDSL